SLDRGEDAEEPERLTFVFVQCDRAEGGADGGAHRELLPVFRETSCFTMQQTYFRCLEHVKFRGTLCTIKGWADPINSSVAPNARTRPGSGSSRPRSSCTRRSGRRRQ